MMLRKPDNAEVWDWWQSKYSELENLVESALSKSASWEAWAAEILGEHMHDEEARASIRANYMLFRSINVESAIASVDAERIRFAHERDAAILERDSLRETLHNERFRVSAYRVARDGARAAEAEAVKERDALLARAEAAERERDSLREALLARHGGEPIALLRELDEARGAKL